MRNESEQVLDNTVVIIATADPLIDCITKSSATLGTIAANGGTGSNDLVSDPLIFKVANLAECTDPANPPQVTFDVFILADGLDGPNVPQKLTLALDLNDLPGTIDFFEDFSSQPPGFTATLGPGDDDGIFADPSGLPCSPYVEEFFWRATGGNPGGGFFCWQDPADDFPNGTYSDLNDSVLLSPILTIGATSTSIRFDHEYRFGSTSTLLIDGVRVDYRVNGGAWQKVTTLPYDGPLIFNSYCNPLCNGGVFGDTCFSENETDGENIFALLDSGTRNWTTVDGSVTDLAPGDQVQFRWRVGSMSTSQYSISTAGGYGLDNVRITNVVEQECDAAVHPDQGCGVGFNSAGNLVEVCGDGDLFVEPTEQWTVDVTLENTGPTDAVDTTADLVVNVASGSGATVTGNPGSYGTIAAGGGLSVATYGFEVDGAACAGDITFDIANITDQLGAYPGVTGAFNVPVGEILASETGNQNQDPIAAADGLTSTTFLPAFTISTPVDAAVVDYDFAFHAGASQETGTQNTDPLTAANAVTTSTLSPAFSILAGDAVTASVDWTNLGHGNVNGCTRVFLRTPNATDIDLKPLGVAPANPYDVLAIYQGPNGGPGQYSIGLQEQQGGAGCTGNATLEGTSMTVTQTPTAGSWTDNARVSLWDGATAHVLKELGAPDASPYDVTSIYNAAGPGTFEVRLEENGSGGTAELSAGTMTVQTAQCDAGCLTGAPPPPPMADGTTGSAMLLGKGATPDELVITIDAGTCADDHAVVLYGNLGDFSGYQGAVDSGCDISTGPMATLQHAGSDVWLNVVWVNVDDVAGHPGFDSTDATRLWNAAGLCGVVSDDASDATCD